jgi:hypothetical protein
MSLEHEVATANLLIDGLAICGFNERNRIWEVAYLRHPEHELGLDLGDGSGVRKIPRDARVIRVETVKGQTPDYDSEFQLGFFDRGPVQDRTLDPLGMSTDEKENFRWAMNLDEGSDVPHGQITLKPPPYPVTMAYISDAVFYSAAITPRNMYLIPLRDNPATMSPTALDRDLYGKTADQIGADIRCAADGGVKVTIDNEELPLLPHTPGSPWKMMLMNMRPFLGGGHHHMEVATTSSDANLEQGDFQIYYDSLDATGEKYSLWGHPSPRFSGRTDCNTPWIRRSSLVALIRP